MKHPTKASPNRTRVAVVATNEDGTKTYYGSMGAYSKAHNITYYEVRAAALHRSRLFNGDLIELVPKSTIIQHLPPPRPKTKQRVNNISVTFSLPRTKDLDMFRLEQHLGLSRAALMRTMVDYFLDAYSDQIEFDYLKEAPDTHAASV